MENLNAGNIINEIQSLIKALKDCGGWVKRGNGEGWFNHEILADALSLITSQEQRIKELGEEVESLKQCMEHEHASFMETFGEYGEKCERLTEEYERLKLEYAGFEAGAKDVISFVKSDTVRKMQERLKPYEHRLSCNFCKHSLRGNRNEKCDKELDCVGWNKWESVIDQIAKEMLEEQT